MYKQSIAVISLLAALTGCASKPENPVDYVTYRDEPLVKQVEDGMTRQQVLSIGGPPSSEVRRNLQPGTCNNYVLNQDGHQQVYYITFDSAGRVDSKGFMSCEQHEINQRALEKL
ncbi:osmotically-inducible lipoprotein OsmE [Pseudomonas cavernae]|uniref:Osmotically-inducible lipoprotein OsmE n=1 Tax=Pseudomonas cavernae TaxID=2320867 RepID=A0A385YXH4_9PSED|nr:osmotically-inducible lipoprotein OsmE [Pseudomonas cavernae]AYC31254.1 osmotically-inducible lipoprotein OsmE [Pseudomonas cavernae]